MKLDGERPGEVRSRAWEHLAERNGSPRFPRFALGGLSLSLSTSLLLMSMALVCGSCVSLKFGELSISISLLTSTLNLGFVYLSI